MLTIITALIKHTPFYYFYNMKVFISGLLFLVFVFVSSASDLHRSPSIADNATALFINPAGLSVLRGPNSSAYFQTDSTGHVDRYELVSTLGHWGFGYRKIGDRKYYAIGRGKPVMRYLSLGTRFIYTAGASSLDFGLLFRPFQRLSLGLGTRNLIQASGAEMSLTTSAGLRPLSFLTTSFDYQWNKGCEAVMSLAGEMNLSRSISLYTSYKPESEEINAGISIYPGRLQLGYRQDMEQDRSAGHVSFSRDYYSLPRSPGIRIAEIRISGRLSDPDPEFSLFGPVWSSTSHIIAQIRKAAMDPGIKGVIISIGDVRSGMASLEEIRNAILEARFSGKRIICHMNSVGMGEYYLASAGSEVIIPPAANWFTPGFGYEVSLYKGLFEKLGIEAEFVVAGKYKGFHEPFTADSLSDAFRENEMRILDGWYNYSVDKISVSRSITLSLLDSVFRHSTVKPEEALELNLVDRIAYYSDIPELIWGKKAEKIDVEKISLYNRNWVSDKKIALIHFSGSIVTGKSFTDFLSGTRVVGSETMCRIIQEAAKDDMIGAIVIRVQSGGGSALASDIIWHEIEKAKKKKPVVISVGDIAASGAYYIACAGNTIIADPGSIVGSIGVFGGKLVLEGLYEKVGLKKEVIKKGEKADAFSPSRHFSAEEREIFEQQIQDIYRLFKSRVAAGRKLDSAALDSVCEGRVFTGKQALENGLVDQLGGLSSAIRAAGRMANIRRKDVEIEVYPKKPSFFAKSGTNNLEQAKINLENLKAYVSQQKIWAIAPWYILP